AREGEAARARQGVDPGGARDRLLPDPQLGRRRDGVPGDAGALSGGRLRPLRARPLPREAGKGARGERPLQARELAAPRRRALRLAHPRPRLSAGGPAMRAVVQRVARAEVRVDGERVGAIGAGLLVLLGVAAGDDEAAAERLAGKVARLRIFERDGRFDASLLDEGGAALVVSQFTLLADTRKGNRPSFT